MSSLLECLAAVEVDGREQLEEQISGLAKFPKARVALMRAYGLAVATEKALVIAKFAMQETGAGANSALQLAARLVAAEIATPLENDPCPETDTDRVVDALDSIVAALVDK